MPSTDWFLQALRWVETSTKVQAVTSPSCATRVTTGQSSRETKNIAAIFSLFMGSYIYIYICDYDWLYHDIVFKGSQEPLILDMTKVNSSEKKDFGCRIWRHIFEPVNLVASQNESALTCLSSFQVELSDENLFQTTRIIPGCHPPKVPIIFQPLRGSNCRLGGCKPSVRSTALSAHLSIKIAAEQRWSWLLHGRRFIFGWEQTGDEKRFPTLTANTIEKHP